MLEVNVRWHYWFDPLSHTRDMIRRFSCLVEWGVTKLASIAVTDSLPARKLAGWLASQKSPNRLVDHRMLSPKFTYSLFFIHPLAFPLIFRMFWNYFIQHIWSSLINMLVSGRVHYPRRSNCIFEIITYQHFLAFLTHWGRVTHASM